jgi:RNA-splicing ligase RtcB
MIKIQGKHNTAVVFADKLDSESKTRIAALLREEAYAKAKIRIMPDVHAGKHGVVGTTMTLQSKVSPMLIGVDIGCGIEVVKLREQTVDLPRFDETVKALIPCDHRIHEKPVSDFPALDRLRCREAVDAERALRSLGTLGGGNHFLELDRDEAGDLYLILHTGSRQLGSDVANAYRDRAYREQCQKARRQQRSATRALRDEDYGMKAIRREAQRKLPVTPDTTLLEGAAFTDYLHDIAIVTAFADHNRRTMATRLLEAMGLTATERFATIHNTIDDKLILRKGAVSAKAGERLIVPLNMRDGALLCVGLGNSDWNFSSPHGAGRACSRGDAKRAYSVEQFQREMAGIYTTTATAGSLEECPMAYKAPERLLSFISETVSVMSWLRPIYNFKAD